MIDLKASKCIEGKEADNRGEGEKMQQKHRKREKEVEINKKRGREREKERQLECDRAREERKAKSNKKHTQIGTERDIQIDRYWIDYGECRIEDKDKGQRRAERIENRGLRIEDSEQKIGGGKWGMEHSRYRRERATHQQQTRRIARNREIRANNRKIQIQD